LHFVALKLLRCHTTSSPAVDSQCKVQADKAAVD